MVTSNQSDVVFALVFANRSAKAGSYHAPLAPQLPEARKVYIKAVSREGAHTDLLNDTFSYLHKCQRFAVVQSPSDAEIIAEIGSYYTGTELKQSRKGNRLARKARQR